MERDEIYSKALRAGRRTYFFDVRSTKAGDYYLTISESKKFTNDLDEGEEYFGVPRGQNSRFELGASITAFYEFELVENVTIEQRVNLYSDYLYKADNIDVDYTLSAFMKINDYLSTTLIVQALYDDNAIKKIQLREVFGLAFVIDIMKIPNVI